jgi:uncharacterized membrane protein
MKLKRQNMKVNYNLVVPMTNNKKKETSKKILWLSYIIGITLTVIVVVCSLLNIECSNITTLAGAAWIEISASNVFYYNMNKKLNVPKIVVGLYNDLPDDLKERIDINDLFSNLMN